MTEINEWTTVAADAVAGDGWYVRAGRAQLWAWVRKSDVGFLWSLLNAFGDVVAKGQAVGAFDKARDEALAASGRFCVHCGKRVLDADEAEAMALAEEADAKYDGGEWSRPAWARQMEKFCSCDDGAPDGEYDLVARHYVGISDDVRLLPVGSFSTRDDAERFAADYYTAFNPFDVGPFKDFLLGFDDGTGPILVATLGANGEAL